MARRLDASKWNSRVRGDHLVDEHHPGLKLIDEALALLVVIRPHTRAQAEANVIGQSNRLILILYTKHGSYRPEQFLTICRSALGDIRQYGWRIEIPRALQRMTSREQLGASQNSLWHVGIEILDAVRRG